MKKTVIMGIDQTVKRIEQTAKLKVIELKGYNWQKQLQSPSAALSYYLSDSFENTLRHF